MNRIGEAAIVIDEAGRLPKGTEVVVLAYSRTTEQYYVRNVDSQYCCWFHPSSLQFHSTIMRPA